MEYADYRRWSARATDWIEQYLGSLRSRRVRAATSPGEITAMFPQSAPERADDMETIFADFERIVPDGLTHWQHPGFFAYFPSNAAPASMIAEQLTAATAAQCMLWQTSPVATEMEIAMTGWLRGALGLPEGYSGVIQDTASTSTLSAVLTMRERALGFSGNASGLSGRERLRIYGTSEAHSSLNKAIRIAGIGDENLVAVETDDDLAMSPSALEAAIRSDTSAGFRPAGVTCIIGGTSLGASDRLRPVLEIARRFGLYSHVDAAWAGSAMICPEFRHVWDGIELADSIVFNPHKWLGAQFDCSVQFLADPGEQVRTLAIRPDYLKTLDRTGTVDFSEWGIPLGRRFRALKIWFLLRAYGLEGLRTRIRNHVAWARELAEKLDGHPEIEVTSPCRFSLFTFRHVPVGGDPDSATRLLLQRINDDGRLYLTQTTCEGRFVIRLVVGQFDCTRSDVMSAYDVIAELAAA